MRKRSLILVSPLLMVFALVACGQTRAVENAAPLKPHAEPLIEQCESLDGKTGNIDSEVADLKRADLKVRIDAAGRLGASCDRRAVAPLLTMLREDADVMGKAAAATALGKLGAPESIDPLREAIADPSWQLRLALGRALCSFQVHRSSYDALNQIVNPTSSAVASDEDLYARLQTILAINQLRDVNFSRKALHFLFFFLEEPDSKKPLRQEMVLATLTELKNTRNGPHEFVGVLKQNLNPAFRIKASDWIGRLGIVSGTDALTEAAASDRDPRVREAALKALQQLKQTASK